MVNVVQPGAAAPATGTLGVIIRSSTKPVSLTDKSVHAKLILVALVMVAVGTVGALIGIDRVVGVIATQEEVIVPLTDAIL